MVIAIAGEVHNCLAAFKRLLSASASTQLPIEGLTEEFGRFRIWAGNISAHTTGRRSLEYRLRDSSELAIAVVGYLQRLSSALQTVIDPQEQHLYGPNAEHDDSDDDLFAEEELGPRPDDQPYSDLLEDIDNIMSSLLRISSALRNPAKKDQIRYADEVSTKHFEQHDIQHVKAKFGGASERLIIRLGKSISRHRQFFKYHEAHNERLKAGIDDDGDAHTVLQGPSTVATSVYQGVEFTPQAVGVDSESVYTATSYAPTLSGKSSLTPPAWPESARDGKVFECPLCFYMISAPDERTWEQHVYDDLPPYVCIHESCDALIRQFSRRRDWWHHMKGHAKQWECPHGCAMPLTSSKQFEQHMRRSHPETIALTPTSALLISCLKEDSSEWSSACPLCLEQQPSISKLYKHISRHLVQLALFAVPPHLLGEAVDEHLGIVDEFAEQTIPNIRSDSESEDEAARYPDASFKLEAPSPEAPMARLDSLEVALDGNRFPTSEELSKDHDGTYYDLARDSHMLANSLSPKDLQSDKEIEQLKEMLVKNKQNDDKSSRLADEIRELKELIRIHEEDRAAREAQWLAEKELETAARKAKVHGEKEVRVEYGKKLADAEKATEELDLAKKALEEQIKKTKSTPDSQQAPIRFKDAVGRKFSFPWSICKTWKGMESLIKQAFLHVDTIGDHVHQGHYDLTGPDGQIILPQIWDSIIQPDWAVEMHLWPLAEEKKPAEEDPTKEFHDPFSNLGIFGAYDLIPEPSKKRGKRGKRRKSRVKELVDLETTHTMPEPPPDAHFAMASPSTSDQQDNVLNPFAGMDGSSPSMISFVDKPSSEDKTDAQRKKNIRSEEFSRLAAWFAGDDIGARPKKG